MHGLGIITDSSLFPHLQRRCVLEDCCVRLHEIQLDSGRGAFGHGPAHFHRLSVLLEVEHPRRSFDGATEALLYPLATPGTRSFNGPNPPHLRQSVAGAHCFSLVVGSVESHVTMPKSLVYDFEWPLD